MVIQNRIEELRKLKGFTQKQLAEMVGLKVLTIRHHEQHRRIVRERHFNKYAKAFGMEAKDLFFIK